MGSYEKLNAYKVAYKLCLGTYQLTKQFPSNEQFAIVSQMRRAAYSVTANIAEGSRKRTAKERIRYHHIAIGSLDELKSFYQLATDLGYCDSEQSEKARKLASDVGKMLVGLNKSLLRNPPMSSEQLAVS